MSFHWPVDIDGLFEERTPQMRANGIPADDIDQVHSRITEMWGDGAGSWPTEWAELGERYAAEGRAALAAVAFGFAKFPGLIDDVQRSAFERQREEYLKAAPDLPVSFERRVLEVQPGVHLPVHILRADGVTANSPVVLASGGVDGWKMDADTVFVAWSRMLPAQLVLFDLPGTGENPVPFSSESLRFLDSLVDAARHLGDGRVAYIGISLGGYYAAYAGLTGLVDAAVDLGGPVEASFTDPNRRWRYGMEGIIGNLLGFDAYPTPAEILDRTRPLGLGSLLHRGEQSRMLVINGADDVHIPQEDTVMFEGLPHVDVQLIPGTGHCAVSEWSSVVPRIAAWVTTRLAETPVPAPAGR